MPGPVSDGFDPEFGTGANAHDVRSAIEEVRDRLCKSLGDRKNILEVVHGKSGEPRHKRGFTLTERDRRVLRFALERSLETL